MMRIAILKAIHNNHFKDKGMFNSDICSFKGNNLNFLKRSFINIPKFDFSRKRTEYASNSNNKNIQVRTPSTSYMVKKNRRQPFNKDENANATRLNKNQKIHTFSINPELDKYLDTLPNKKSIAQRYIDFNTKYPSPEHMLQHILNEKKKYDPKFSLDEITNEDVENFMDPVVLAICRDFPKWKDKISLENKVNLDSNSENGQTIDKEKTQNKESSINEIHDKSNAYPSISNSISNDYNIPELDTRHIKFDESESDLRKIKGKIFAKNVENKEQEGLKDKRKKEKKSKGKKNN